MSANIQVKADFRPLETSLRTMSSKTKYVLAQTLTNVAQTAKVMETIAIAKSFDAPTPWTVNAIYSTNARSNQLYVEIGIKNNAISHGIPAAKYLYNQIYGGVRSDKRLERALRAAGVLPAGYEVMPGPAMQLDQFGNMYGTQVRTILKALKAYQGDMRRRGRNLVRGGVSLAGNYFTLATQRGKLAPGVYLRDNRHHNARLKLMLVFGKPAAYHMRYDFFGVGMKAIQASYDHSFHAAFAKAFPDAVASGKLSHN